MRTVFVALFMLASRSAAQDTIRVSDAPACGCKIVLERQAVLGSETDSISPRFDSPITISRDSRGRFYVAPMLGWSSIGVYGGDGRLLRLLGRRGRGPGEFGAVIEAKILPGDTVVAVDRSNHRITFFTPDYRVARTVTLQSQVEGIVFGPNQRFAARWTSSAPDMLGKLVHLHASDGQYERPLLAERNYIQRGFNHYRNIAPASNGLWVVPAARYVITGVTLGGSIQKVLKREAAWFQPWEEMQVEQTFVKSRQPWIESIREDSAGLLWITMHVAQANWRANPNAFQLTPGGETVKSLTVADREAYEDTLIEVIDPKAGILLARTRLDGLFFGYLNSGANLYSRRRSHETAGVQVEVYRFTLSK